MWSPQPHVWQPATGLLALLLSAGCADPGGQGAPGTLSEDTPEETPVPELVDSPPAAPPVEQATLPPYPVVLAHGFLGFDEFAGQDFATYFFEVRDQLRAQGEGLVFTTAVDPFNDSATRGAALAEQVSDILQETGHQRVVVIGHSQGGLDGRVLAHLHPERVAAVVTLATPHGGTPVADRVVELAGEGGGALVDAAARLLGGPLNDMVGEETSVMKALRGFSTAEIGVFNAAYPDVEGVTYYSLTGRTSSHPGGEDCLPDRPVDFVERFEATVDPIDPALAVFAPRLAGDLLAPLPHDGLLRAQDARWGEFLGCVPADHLDQIGQLLGDGPGLGNPWLHHDFYLDLLRFIRNEGF